MVRDASGFTGAGAYRAGWGGVVTLVERWAATLGGNRRAAGLAGGHAGLTTGNPRWATMQWRDLPCIIRAHLSIRIKGYYA